MTKWTPETMAEDYDWKQAFGYGGQPDTHAIYEGPCEPMPCEGSECSLEPVLVENIVEVIQAIEGENDGADWIAVVRLKDGRYAFVQAGCDYTGWDCQAGGQVWVSDSLENLWQFGVTNEARDRFEEND